MHFPHSLSSSPSTPVVSPIQSPIIDLTSSPTAPVLTTTVNLNLRAMMTAFYLGTGPRDVGNALSFLGVPGGNTWHNFFYENMEKVNNVIMSECQEMIDEGLWNEIRATIKSKLGSKYSS